MKHLHAVILAGGSGTRLWPLSTPGFPKQFLPLPSGKTMIQETLARVAPLISPERAWVVAGRSMVELVHEHLPSIPLNHMLAYELAEQEHLVTLGIKPTAPETGYGYIRFAVAIGEGHAYQAYRVERFVEKPNLATAKSYLQDGHYVWNSGMFIWKVETILAEIRAHLPELARKIDIIINATGTGQEQATLDEIWPTLTAISIDYGIMEKSKNIAVIPVDLGWNDVGNWEQYGSLFPSDERGVSGIGSHISLGSQNIFVYNNTPRQVYTIGLEDVIVVEMEDKTVICHKDHVQRVKELAEKEQKFL